MCAMHPLFTVSSTRLLTKVFRIITKTTAQPHFTVTLNHSMTSSKPFKVYVTRKIPSGALDLLRNECDIIQWKSDEPVPRQELLNNVSGIDALFCLLTDKIDATIIKSSGQP